MPPIELSTAIAGLSLAAAIAVRHWSSRWRERLALQSRVSSLPAGVCAPPRQAERVEQVQFWVAAGTAIAGFGASIAGLDWSAAALAAAALLSCIYLVWALLGLVLQKRYAADTAPLRLSASIGEIARAKPAFAFHFSGPDLAFPSHVTMWLPYLERLGRPFTVLVREHQHLGALAGTTQAPVIHVSKDADLEGAIPPSVGTMFYANNAIKNRKLVASLPHCEHIQLLHGDSDKPPSYSPVSQIYSRLFVAGRMAIDRYARHGVDIPEENFAIVGRPQVERIVDIKDHVRGDVLKVAYLPTWVGYFEDSQLSSVDQAAQIIEAALSSELKLELLFKPHPMSQKEKRWSEYEAAIRAAISKPRANGNRGVWCDVALDPFDLYNAADVLITDISSVMIDFLYSGKPYLVAIPGGMRNEEMKSYPSLEGGYILKRNGSNVAQQLALAAGDDPMREKRMAVRAYAFGDLDHPPGERFRKTCLEIIDRGSVATGT